MLISELEQELERDVNQGEIMNKIVNVYQTNEDTIEIELTYEVLETIGTEEKF